MKSGTNNPNGTAYYFGRNPALNAASNPITHAPNQVRNHIVGAVAGHPIVKNKIFHFFAYEQWRQQEPRSKVMTLPAALEKQGDFSQSKNANGGLRTIYDPFTTQLDASGQVTRQPFPGNVIPLARQDPVSRKFMDQVWAPNNPGDDITGVNNFRADYYRANSYRNISSRVDYLLTEKLRVFGRYSVFKTNLIDQDYTPNGTIIYEDVNSGVMNATNVSGDAIYTISPSTILSVRGSFATMKDAFDGSKQKIEPSRLMEYWAKDWYTPYLNPDYGKFFFPGVNVDGSTFGKSSWFLENPQHYFLSAKISRNAGRHYLKSGGEWRYLRSFGAQARSFSFVFNRALTAETFINPNTRLNGDPYATLLLGAIDSSSNAQVSPAITPSVHYQGFFIQDDFKISNRVTLNLGLRYEYETPPFDRGGEYRLSRPFDRDSPIPEMQATPPPIPQEARDLYGKPFLFNGAWQFTDASQPGMWENKKLNLLPRVGLAVRIDDRTAIRAGYARFLTPANVQVSIIGSLPYPGFSGITEAAPVIEGRPQAVWSDPFPASNPLIPVLGKSLGRYTNLGGDVSTDVLKFRPNVNDRINVSVQREVIWKVITDVTYFANIGHDLPYTQRFNMMDPQLSYTYKTQLNRSIANPFYQYLTPATVPGQLRNQRQVTLGSLLKPYPQYGSISQTNTPGVREHYHALQVKIQRPFANGFNFLLAYNYNRERQEEFFNSDEEYLGQFPFEDVSRPRQRMTVAGVYELPIGRRRRFLSNTPVLLDHIAGGWTISSVYYYNSGNILRFDQMDVIGDPNIDNPSKWGLMFNPAAFRQSAAFTPRVNPKTMPGIIGPGYKSMDVTLAKFFNLTERFRLELKMEGYNISNTFNAGDPELRVTRSNFGRTFQPAPGAGGREFQYNLKLHF